ncbi:hypothetical protein OAT67_09055 [Bacteriovoracaceae bacterium]|nr:hypothetical protein [Bacteriovoracaceae bacterium]
MGQVTNSIANIDSQKKIKLTFTNNKRIFGAYQLSEATIYDKAQKKTRPFRQDLTNIIIGKNDIVIVSDSVKNGKLTTIDYLKLPHKKVGKSYKVKPKILSKELSDKLHSFLDYKIAIKKDSRIEHLKCRRFNKKVVCHLTMEQ